MSSVLALKRNSIHRPILFRSRRRTRRAAARARAAGQARPRAGAGLRPGRRRSCAERRDRGRGLETARLCRRADRRPRALLRGEIRGRARRHGLEGASASRSTIASMCRRATSRQGNRRSSRRTSRRGRCRRAGSSRRRRGAAGRRRCGAGRRHHRHRPSAVEDALVGLADEGDLVGLRLHDLDVRELAPQAALHGEDRAEQRDAPDLARAQFRRERLDDVDQRDGQQRFRARRCRCAA